MTTRPLDLFDELRALTTSLDQAGVPYAVCGALALAIHGHPRATMDLDLLTSLAAVDRLKAIAKVHGFGLEALPMRFRSSGITVHRISRIVDTQILSLDVLVSDGVLDTVWEAREQVSLAGGPLWVVSRAGLVTMKLAAGRPQDLADLARLQGAP